MPKFLACTTRYDNSFIRIQDTARPSPVMTRGRWAGRAPSSTNPDRERVISRHVSLPDGAPVSSLRGAPTPARLRLGGLFGGAG